MELTDDQWKIIEPMFPRKKPREDGKGRPPTEYRAVLEGILWILRSGARWKDLPKEFPPYQTCHRWCQIWVKAGVFRKTLKKLAEDLRDRGELDLTETFIDGTFSSAKKGVQKSVKPKKVKGPRSWQLRTAQVYLSPYALKVLHRMRYDWLKIHSKIDLPDSVLKKQSEIKPMTVIRLMNEWQSGLKPSSSLHTKLIESQKTHKMAENYADIDADGKSNGYLLGYTILEELLHDGKRKRKTT